ncbi:PREDICTED: leukocyte-associated immunoglobulin-like receptor 2 [Propithecus coquereli]|uniref:leukocyte-associated immunoglobulin-like receptor 2 n=1 Tax=Propithecus coquereli TaxID=379532 RepID=UPI00063F908F|nr:PREDICTED: leukocyte-associated immunoglobulin-like receptor 2 [Propithecus coquereli]
MHPQPTTLLGLVLCLGQTTHTQEGPLPRPSISAEPDSKIRWGRPVTVVCRGPAWAETFHLVRESGIPKFLNVNAVPGPSEAEARFPINTSSEASAGRYYCTYCKRSRWSERSESLELVVTAGTSQNYTLGNFVRMGLAGVVLLILVAILAEAWHSQRDSNGALRDGDQRAPAREIRPQGPGGTSPRF